MGIFKRALIAIKKRKTKTFLIFSILFIIGTMIMASIAIQKSINEATIIARRQLGSTITISYDVQKVMENSRKQNTSFGGKDIRTSSEPIKEEWFNDIINLSNIKGYNYIVTGSGDAVDFEEVEDNFTSTEVSNTQSMNEVGNRPKNNNEKMVMVAGGLKINGYLDTSILTDKITIVEGSNLGLTNVSKNHIIIEKNLAEYNELILGDKITIKPTTEGFEEMEFEIVGIFETNNVNSFRPVTDYNTVYMPYDIVSKYFKRASYDSTTSNTTYNEGIDSVTLYIDDPVNIDLVKNEITSIGTIDQEKYKIDTEDDVYQKMIEPITNLSGFSKNSVIVIVISGVIILMLVLTLFTKERTYEVGVLMSLGERKLKICLQYLVEVFVISIASFSLAVFSGNILSNSIKDTLIQSEISSLQKDNTKDLSTKRGNEPGGAMRMPNEQGNFNQDRNQNSKIDNYVTDIDIKITIQEILQLFGIGNVIILLSIFVPLLIVTRYSPRKILASQE